MVYFAKIIYHTNPFMGANNCAYTFIDTSKSKRLSIQLLQASIAHLRLLSRANMRGKSEIEWH
jgi:hypothetical protein